MRVLGLDIGSSSVKAGVWDARRGQILGRVRVAYPSIQEGDRAEVDAAALFGAVRRAGRAALQGASGRVDAVCFCAFSSGVVVTDSHGAPRTRIITHADRRSADVARDLVRMRSKRWWLERTSNLPYPGGIGSSTLAWLRRHSPAVFCGKYRAGQVSSLIGQMLTGEWITDPSQAVFLGLWDVRRHAWSAEVCRIVGLEPAALPRVQWADERVGGLSVPLARWWGMASGTPVVGGCVDTSAAVIQTPMAAGQLAHNTGSTDVLAMCLDEPRPAEGILTRPVGTGRNYPAKWLAVRTIAASGSALHWARTTLFGEVNDRAWARALDRACAQAQRHEASAAPLCLPAFAGERASIGQSAGAEFRGLRLGTSREDLLQALVRALAAQSAADYARLAKLHRPLRNVYAMGAAGSLAEVMHRGWGGRHRFLRLAGDSLSGLGELAARTLSGDGGGAATSAP